MEDRYFFNFDKIAYVRAKRPDTCVLCAIRDGDPEVTDLSVYRDDLVIVTVNLYPYNPGHLLVFPSRHVEDLRHLEEGEERRMAEITRAALDALDQTHHPAGYNVGVNMGLVAGASIRHLHTHVIPRFPSELGIADLVGGKRVLVEDPRVTRKRLRAALESLEGRPTP